MGEAILFGRIKQDLQNNPMHSRRVSDFKGLPGPLGGLRKIA